MMELVLTGLVAVGIPMRLAVEELMHRRQADSRQAQEVHTAESKPESRRAAAVAVVAPSRKPARARYAA